MRVLSNLLHNILHNNLHIICIEWNRHIHDYCINDRDIIILDIIIYSCEVIFEYNIRTSTSACHQKLLLLWDDLTQHTDNDNDEPSCLIHTSQSFDNIYLSIYGSANFPNNSVDMFIYYKHFPISQASIDILLKLRNKSIWMLCNSNLHFNL